jgi:hypothetical protein
MKTTIEISFALAISVVLILLLVALAAKLDATLTKIRDQRPSA